VPIVFDFSKPDRLTLIETIKVIAGLSRFIIADIAAPRSVPQELEAVVKNYKIPVVPILHNDEEPFATYEDFKEIDWVLPLLRYNTVDELFKAFDRAVVEAALQKSDELLVKKAEAIRERRASDYS
jgi:hypothetical protein